MTRRQDPSSPPRRYWTAAELDLLRAQYPVRRTQDLARALGRSEPSAYGMAEKLGLKKSADYLASPASGRLLRGQTRSPGTQFRTGMSPWNKGTRFVSVGRSAETQFKAGNLPPTTRPIGSLRITAEGHLEQKFRERPGNNSQRWRGVHRLVWEAEHGPAPHGSVVAFRPGMSTNVLAEITLDRLELITRAELITRNGVQRFPPELRRVIQLRGALQTQINRRTRTA